VADHLPISLYAYEYVDSSYSRERRSKKILFDEHPSSMVVAVESNVGRQKLGKFRAREDLFERNPNLVPSENCRPARVRAPHLVGVDPKIRHSLNVRRFEMGVKRIVDCF